MEWIMLSKDSAVFRIRIIFCSIDPDPHSQCGSGPWSSQSKIDKKEEILKKTLKEEINLLTLLM